MTELANLPPEDDAQDAPPSGPSMTRWVMIGAGGVALMILLLFLVAIIGGVADSAGVANFFRILRDFFIVVLALQGVLICMALVVLTLQISTLINILSSEVKPIIEETRETVATARGTAEFMSKNVATPFIKTAANATGALVFLREILAIRRLISGKAKK
jgi:hypothetical protein